MKVEELRVGNLVKINGEINQIELCDFVDIYEHKIIWHYEPVNLNDYWFNKLGFETDKTEWWDGVICLGIFKDGFYYLPTESLEYRVGQEIKYVHQLQNLYYSITGSDYPNTDINSTRVYLE